MRRNEIMTVGGEFILDTEIRSNNVRMSENVDQFVGELEIVIQNTTIDSTFTFMLMTLKLYPYP